MQEIIKAFLTSKKAIAMIAGIVVALLAKYQIDLPEETVNRVIGVIIAYIVGQGIADNGKEAERMRRGET